MSMRRKLTEKLQERTALLEKAEGLLQEGSREEYKAQMDLVKAMNTDIQALQDLIQEQDRKFMKQAPDLAEERDKAEERGNALMKGQEVKFSALEVSKALFLPQHAVEKSVTLATGTLAQPTGAGTNIRDPLGNGVGAIIDQVYVQDLTGMASYLEPYVISEFNASGADVATSAGTARTASGDPTFGVAKIAPYELTTTSYVDRNISRLTPANYYAKVYAMAIRAMRRDRAGQKQHTWRGDPVTQKQVTRWLERGHGTPQGGYVKGRQFYSFTRMKAWEHARKAADRVLSLIADEVDF